MNYFYDIAVYRLEEEKYYRELKEYKNAHLFGSNENEIKLKKEFYEKYPEQKNNFEEYLFKKFGGQWEFNEVVAYIKLYTVGNQIRGEYFQIDKKRIYKTRDKTFEWKSDKLVPELSFYKNQTNEEIFMNICKYLNNCEKELKNRYLDLDNFLKVGKYIDWKSLLNGIART